MGRVLTGVLDLDSRLRHGPRHGLLGTGSIHASLIEGGQEMSTYPAHCVAKLERRTVPGENGATSLRRSSSSSATRRPPPACSWKGRRRRAPSTRDRKR